MKIFDKIWLLCTDEIPKISLKMFGRLQQDGSQKSKFVRIVHQASKKPKFVRTGPSGPETANFRSDWPSGLKNKPPNDNQTANWLGSWDVP